MAQEKKKWKASGASVAVVAGGLVVAGAVYYCMYNYLRSSKNVPEQKIEEPIGPRDDSSVSLHPKTPRLQEQEQEELQTIPETEQEQYDSDQEQDSGQEQYDSDQEQDSGQEQYDSEDEQEPDKNKVICDKDILLQVLTDTYQGMEKLSKDSEKLHEKLQNEGQDDYKIDETINERVTRAFSLLTKEVIKRHNTSVEDVTKAKRVYENDPDIIEVNNKISFLNAKLIGETPDLNGSQLSKIPRNLTVEKLIEILYEMIPLMKTARNDAIKEIQEEQQLQRIPKIDVENRYNEKFLILKNEARKKEKFPSFDSGINDEIIDLAVQKYSNNPKFIGAIAKIEKTRLESFKEIDKGVVYDS